MSVFKHQHWANNVFINIITRIVTRSHSAHVFNDVDIDVFNSQFKIPNFQKSKGVFVANIEILLAKKWKMQTQIIQKKINDMQVWLNVSFKSAISAASKAPKSDTTATKNSVIEINKNFRIFFFAIKYSFISHELFV